MTEFQRKIVEYSDSNKDKSQAQIARVFGTHQGTVSKILRKYRPNRVTIKPFEMTEYQKRIVQYADENPDMPQMQIALDLGTDQGTVSRTLSLYRPDRKNKSLTASESKFIMEIQEYKINHMNMGIEAIAIEFGVSKYQVSKALQGFPKASPGRKNKSTIQYKKRRCLKCDEEFNSSWVGERLCVNCKLTMESETIYSPTYSIGGYAF